MVVRGGVGRRATAHCHHCPGRPGLEAPTRLTPPLRLLLGGHPPLLLCRAWTRSVDPSGRHRGPAPSSELSVPGHHQRHRALWERWPVQCPGVLCCNWPARSHLMRASAGGPHCGQVGMVPCSWTVRGHLGAGVTAVRPSLGPRSRPSLKCDSCGAEVPLRSERGVRPDRRHQTPQQLPARSRRSPAGQQARTGQ